jgi:hypothetical protein
MNGNRDIVFKRCGCTDAGTGHQLAGSCPRLAEPGHGSWYYAVQVITVGGRKAQLPAGRVRDQGGGRGRAGGHPRRSGR